MNTELGTCEFPVSESCLSGEEIGKSLPEDRFKREEFIFDLFKKGYVPEFMSKMCPVEIDLPELKSTFTFYVTPDYLCFGTNEDYLRTPLFPGTAQNIADSLNCVLPTSKIVDMIFKQADLLLSPIPWGPPYDSSMMNTSRIVEHNRRITKQLSEDWDPVEKLVVGCKKDVIIDVGLLTKKDRVAIYGWHKTCGIPIQEVYLGHESKYCDYSHGIRLVSRNACVKAYDSDDVEIVDIKSVYLDTYIYKGGKSFLRLISNTKPLGVCRY